MTDMKNSLQADATGYLYRAAFYLAKGDQASALNFLDISRKNLPENNLAPLQPLFENPKALLSSEPQRKLWAEKILDEYRLLTTKLTQ